MVSALYEDKFFHCKDCGVEFLFSSGEQEFFASKGYANTPVRCLRCRAANRARLSAAPASTTPAREMHPVVCADCGAETKVPFLPRLDKPVYCSTCFDKVRARLRIVPPASSAS